MCRESRIWRDNTWWSYVQKTDNQMWGESMPDELIIMPCPSCGSDYNLLLDCFYPERGPRYYVTCEICRTNGPECESKAWAIKTWNNMPRKLRWTTEPPAQAGWYFLREVLASGKWRNYGPVSVYWDQDTNALQIRGWGRTTDGVTNCGHYAQTRKPEWAGPIPLPQE